MSTALEPMAPKSTFLVGIFKDDWWGAQRAGIGIVFDGYGPDNKNYHRQIPYRRRPTRSSIPTASVEPAGIYFTSTVSKPAGQVTAASPKTRNGSYCPSKFPAGTALRTATTTARATLKEQAVASQFIVDYVRAYQYNDLPVDTGNFQEYTAKGGRMALLPPFNDRYGFIPRFSRCRA